MTRIKWAVMRWLDRWMARSSPNYRAIKTERAASIQRRAERQRSSLVIQRVLGQQEGRPR